MNYKALTLGAILGLAAALVPSCGGKTCGPSNCQGCCDTANNCVMTQTNASCGKSGLACVDCSTKMATPTCNTASGQCTNGNAGGGAGGGSATGGGAATGGGSATGGGTGGCNGCCSGNLSPGSGGCAVGTCVGGTAATNCGANGAACANCSTMTPPEICSNHACTGGAGGGSGNDGGVTGQIGSPCTTNADCNHESGSAPGATGTGSYCKTEQLQITPGANGGLQIVPGAAYPGGYCSHRCVQDSDCGSQGFCSWYYGLGQTGEADNYCIAKCDANQMCRTGYNCVNFGSTSTPLLGCLLAGDGGSTFDTFDAGIGGNPLVQGNGCAMDSDCQPPNTGSCIPGTFDGGPSGFPGGACTADCTMHPTNQWCGNGSVCAPAEADVGDGLGYLIDWSCLGKCWELSDGGQGLEDGGTPLYSCRQGYHCREVFTDHSGGCEADCDNAGAGCATGFSCDTTSHTCQ